jgi:gluconolactonase
MSARAISVLAVVVAALGSVATAAPTALNPLDNRADVTVNLTTREGMSLLKGEWRYSDTRIVEIDSKGPGPDLKPSGAPIKTYDYLPKAGGADFDDSRWPVIDPASLEQRRSTGRLCFNWYRTKLTIPERIGRFETRGSTVVFELVVDDYAEVWVNGKLPRVLGQSGGSLVRGFNAPNRVVLGRNVQPGQQFQIAVFGANGPLSDPPPNFIWVRTASLDFYKGSGDSSPPQIGVVVKGEIERRDSGLDAIVPPDAKIVKLAEGFQFTEGPVWHPDGYLLFSDPNNNTIYRWSPDDGVSIYRAKSGYSGIDIGEYGQPGSNGLTLDKQGRLTICEHGNRRVTRLEKNGVLTVLADRYEGKRLNSPNDLVYRSDGTLYFTDPPFGLPKFFDDPRKELPYSGVFRVKDGRIDLVSTDVTGPNGLAFSPDEKYLYVANWDEKSKVLMRYEVSADGSLSHGRVFFDMTAAPGEDALDGMKVDQQGNLFVSGPGGLWILSSDGRHLGTIRPPEHPHNLAWGGADGRTLFMAAQTGIYCIRLSISGIRPL